MANILSDAKEDGLWGWRKSPFWWTGQCPGHLPSKVCLEFFLLGALSENSRAASSEDESPFFPSCHFVGSGVYLTLGTSPFPQQPMACLLHRTAILQEWLLETVPLNWAWWRASAVLTVGRLQQENCLNSRVPNQPGQHYIIPFWKKKNSGERVSTQTLISKLPCEVELLNSVTREHSSEYLGWEAVRNRAIFSFHFYVLER